MIRVPAAAVKNSKNAAGVPGNMISRKQFLTEMCMSGVHKKSQLESFLEIEKERRLW